MGAREGWVCVCERERGLVVYVGVYVWGCVPMVGLEL